MGPNPNDGCPYDSRKCGPETDTQREGDVKCQGGCYEKTEAETEITLPQARKGQNYWKLEESKKDPYPVSFKGNMALLTDACPQQTVQPGKAPLSNTRSKRLGLGRCSH